MMIIRLAERELKTKFGVFTEILYYDGRSESIALVTGDVAENNDVLCRVHSHCISAHIFNSIECDCREQMEFAQKLIENEGKGAVIWLDQEGKGNGHLALIQSMPFKKEFGQAEAYKMAGYKADNRTYLAAAQIISDLKIRSIILLANDPAKADYLRDASIIVSGTRSLL